MLHYLCVKREFGKGVNKGSNAYSPGPGNKQHDESKPTEALTHTPAMGLCCIKW